MKVVGKLHRIPRLYVQKIQQLSIRGTLDLFICFRGWFIAWELKTDDGRTSKLQEYEITRIRQAEGIAMVITPSNLDESIDFLLSLPQNKR